MDDYTAAAGWCLLGYLFGSCPTGYVLVRMILGEDIRRFGSGNIGATNVSRVLGRGWAIFTAIFDMLKGGLAIVIAILCGVTSDTTLAVTGAAAVIGHDYPIWLGFRGGKGVATSFGALAFYDLFCPWPALIGGAVWVTSREITRYVSLSSIAGLAASAAAMPFFTDDIGCRACAVFLALLTAWRHRENIIRLIHGTESTVQPITPKLAGFFRKKFSRRH